MGSDPQSRQFYRPILEDIRRVAATWKQRWRTSFALADRVKPKYVVLAAFVLFAGVVALWCIDRSIKYEKYLDLTTAPEERLAIQTLDEWGARWRVDEDRHVSLVFAKSKAIGDEDLVILHGLSHLKTVILRETNVTEEGVAHLQSALPDCVIVIE